MYCSKLKSISLFRPGVSNNINNSENMLLSEKDLNAVEFNFLVRPTLEFKHDHHHCQISLSLSSSSSSSEEEDQEEDVVHEQNQEDQPRKSEDKFDMLVSTLKLKIPSSEESRSSTALEDQENVCAEGFKTPTSSDHKIPAAFQCPPAPRKPKSVPLSKKLKLPISRPHRRRRRFLLDLTSEIESLFPPAILADLGGKIKKVRQAGSGNIL